MNVARRFRPHLFVWLPVLILALAVPGQAQFKETPEGGFPPPKGQIAFARDADLWIMDADGRNAKKIYMSARIASRIVWSPDNKEILFCQAGAQSYQLPEGGGGAVKLYDVFATRVDFPGDVRQVTRDALSNAPAYFPDGQRIAFTKNLNAFDVHAVTPMYQIYVGGVYGKPPHKNLNKGVVDENLQLMMPAPSPDGKTIACVVTSPAALATAMHSVGIAFFPAEGYRDSTQTWIERAGKIPKGYGPSWSPDGRLVAFMDGGSTPRTLAIWDYKRGTRRNVYTPPTGTDLNNAAPSWSADGNWLVVANDKGNILLIDRTGKTVRALTTQGTDVYPAFSN